MKKKITAHFQDPDSADLASARLRSSGINVSAVSIGRALEGVNVGGMRLTGSAPEIVINPYDAGYSNSIDENWTSLAGANMQNYGGFLWSFEDNPLRTLPRSDMAAEGALAGGVTFTAEIPEEQARDAEGIIISCHGTQVYYE